MLARTIYASAIVLMLTACGGGGGGDSSSNGGPSVSVPPVATPVLSHRGVSVGYGTRRDGVDGRTLAGFLTHHRRTDSPYGEGLRWASTPPVVRVVSGAAAQYVQQTRRAVEIINSALPPNWQMTFDPTPRNARERTFGHANEEYFDGEITVLFANSENYGRHGGWSQARPGRDPDHYGDEDVVVASRVSVAIDHGGTATHRLALIIHEIGHTLGIGGDSWADIWKLYPNSIMTYQPGQRLRPNGRAMIYPLDRDSFRALYSVLEPGMTPDETYAALGDWMDTTIHIHGELPLSADGALSFGASGRNGYADPYADGPPPDMELARNDALSGMASWGGRLLGLDVEANSVGGAADLSVDLGTLTGDLRFSSLESWAAGQAPGPIGSGELWGDGDLAYSIRVYRNSFVRTGGDEGTVRGAFFGSSHEGMGGTLVRADLSAGFGGRR